MEAKKVTTASASDPLLVSWLTVKVRVRVAMLRTDQTVGSSVMNARVVTVSGVTSPPYYLEEWDRCRLGHPAVEVLAEAPRLNVLPLPIFGFAVKRDISR